MEKILRFTGLMVILLLASCSETEKEDSHTSYQTDGNWITGYNYNRYNNRPLYINNTNGFILTGDKPLIRLVKDDRLFGTLSISLPNDGDTIRIVDFDQIVSHYAPGQMRWDLGDRRVKDIDLKMNVLPIANGIGMVVRMIIDKARINHELVWSFGGARQYEGEQLSWNYDAMGHPEILSWDDAGDPNSKPQFMGTFQINTADEHYLSFELDSEGEVRYHTGEKARFVYKKAQDKLGDLVGRMKINTPDPYLNAIARASVVAVDGTWYPPVFVHGCMQWNMRFPGWRTIYGGTMYGWHDRVYDEANYFISSQTKESDKKTAKAHPGLLMTGQHPDSRFYGVGRIQKDQLFYNMQSQFFDQLINEYRWTADTGLIKVLREALELHLIWIRDCFDPDGDGIYESYINSWPSDSQWYNGGGSAEETSYAYRGHKAARDMAHKAGDSESENYHNQMLERIKKGFFDKLWISDKGHSGAYLEQGGHKRLHTNPSTYSIFLPVDAGLTSPLQAIESVYYTEWALQNDTLAAGGRQVYNSNWVPGIWSVRVKSPADNYHLALSYFKAGLPEDGWDLMRGSYISTAFNHLVPGNLGDQNGGIDFGDCVHIFSRTLVEGLFGYIPDYPNGRVKIAPQFPKDWDYASIELPDVKIEFERNSTFINYSFELSRKADMILMLPVQCSSIKNVTLNKKQAKWELIPGVGYSIVKMDIEQADKANISIETTGQLPYYEPVLIEGNTGDKIEIIAQDAQIVSFEDPQEVITEEIIQEGILKARLADKEGYHTVVVTSLAGKAPQYRIFRIKINNPEKKIKEGERYMDKIPEEAHWESIDIASLYNADIKTIYQQQYLSPRSNTVSLRLGTDGYSPWTFPYWKSTPPDINTDNIKSMLNGENHLLSPQGVPFRWDTAYRNITFTSMWDNYPVKVDFPINKTGKAVYFLVSGSTNVMQCEIANAVIRLNYADGQTDSLELIPPVNYWNLSTIDSHATAPGQGSRNDYSAEEDRFCMPEKLPETVQLGENCRAMLLNLKMRENVELKSITLETLSQEVVVGLIGVTILND